MTMTIGPYRPAADGRLDGRMVRDIEIREQDERQRLGGIVTRTLVRERSGRLVAVPESIPEV